MSLECMIFQLIYTHSQVNESVSYKGQLMLQGCKPYHIRVTDI
jgi:hypothetical protein